MAKSASGPKRSKKSKEEILAGAVRMLSREPAAGVTVEEVAREAGCAKGLVHYHFKTKDGLFAAAASSIWDNRVHRWEQALAATDPQEAIDASWRLLADESNSGTAKACASLAVDRGELTVRAVKNATADFSAHLALAVRDLFSRIGLVPTIPAGELGALLAAVVAGFGHQMDAGAAAADLESAYAAYWAGLLSLGSPG